MTLLSDNSLALSNSPSDKEHYGALVWSIAGSLEDATETTQATSCVLRGLSSVNTNPSEQEVNEVVQKMKMMSLKEASSMHTCYNLNDGRYVKVSNALDGTGLAEARVMDFIRNHTKIPVPRVHMVFERAGEFYNVMDYVPGERLSRSYGNSAEDLQNISSQLADIIRQIRAIPIPQQSLIGTWDGRPFKNTWFRPLPWDRNVTPSGVFHSVAEYNDYWIRRSQLDIAAPHVGSTQIVLSHGDLNGANIIVKNGQIAAILDWDTFGWYPDFWELIPPRIWVTGGKIWLEAMDRTFGPEAEINILYKELLVSAFSKPVVDTTLLPSNA